MGALNEGGESPARCVDRKIDTGGAGFNHKYLTRQAYPKVLPNEVLFQYPVEPKETKSFNNIPRKRKSDGSFLNPFAKKVKSNFKSTVYISEGVFSPKTAANFKNEISANIACHRKASFSTPTPKSKKPKVAYTESGTKLDNRTDFGPITVYQVGDNPKINEKDLNLRSKEIIAQTLSSPDLIQKSFSSKITKADILKAKRQKRTSQQAVMGCSAKSEVASYKKEMTNNCRMHYMHLIAWFMLGKKSQCPQNMVVGTSSANYRHLFLELEVPYLLKYFDEVEVNAQASIIEGTNIAKEINYQLKTKNFEINFKLDAQSKDFAKSHEGEYIHSFVKTYLERNIKEDDVCKTISFC